jgi:beta-glucanase (GH16 family)
MKNPLRGKKLGHRPWLLGALCLLAIALLGMSAATAEPRGSKWVRHAGPKQALVVGAATMARTSTTLAPTTTAAPTTTVAPTTTAAPPPTTAAPAPTGWRTVFADEFNGGSLDYSKWWVDNKAASNWGELSYYSPEDAFVRDGALVLRAQQRNVNGRSYTSANMGSNFSFRYGRVEVRAKMPTGKGLWPAVWMLPTNGASTGWLPEIDIYESIDPGRFWANFHSNTGSGRQQLGPLPVSTDTSQWHNYAVEWSPTQITWFLDGGPVAVATDGVWTANQSNMYITLTLAVGGSWPGSPDASTPFPSEMQIDYIRVLQN